MASQLCTGTTKLTPASSPFEVAKVGVIGLGAMGMGMAMSLLRAGYPVQGYDVNPAAAKAFAQAPGQASIGTTIQETIAGASVVLLMVQNAAQAEDVLFGSGGIGAASLVDGAVVILSSTVAPAFARELNAKLNALHRNIALIDAPVSGGIARAANGTLTVCFAHFSIYLVSWMANLTWRTRLFARETSLH